MELYYCKTCDEVRRSFLDGERCPVCKGHLQRIYTPELGDSSRMSKRPLTLEESIEDKVARIDVLLRSIIIDAADLGYAPLVQCLSDSFLRLYDAKQEMFWKRRERSTAFLGMDEEV
uniref:Uncharacterized protein n=1 Tax=viral metagenome TaxID=1070528 RepID=A0A6M3M3A6_9ZZZZ